MQLAIKDTCLATRTVILEILTALHKMNIFSDFSTEFQQNLKHLLSERSISSKGDFLICQQLHTRAVAKLSCLISGRASAKNFVDFENLLSHADNDVIKECVEYLSENAACVEEKIIETVLRRIYVEKDAECLKLLLGACIKWYPVCPNVFLYDAEKLMSTLMQVMTSFDANAPLLASGIRLSGCLVASALSSTNEKVSY